jgi:Protein HRI1
MEQYIGFWKRASIQVGDNAPSENATVYWLQAETYFADIRIPFSQPLLSQPLLSLNRNSLLPFAEINAFAGTIACTETWIRWHRMVDFKPSSNIDQGKVHFVGTDLIEQGESNVDGKVEAYTEVWQPQMIEHGDRLVLELVKAINLTTQVVTYPKGLWVTVGNHAIRICDNRGYTDDFIAPEPAQLSEVGLKHLMQFQADYSEYGGVGDRPEKRWETMLSSDPSRMGRPLAPPTQAQDGALVEIQSQASGETVEYHWEIREAAGNLSGVTELGYENPVPLPS